MFQTYHLFVVRRSAIEPADLDDLMRIVCVVEAFEGLRGVNEGTGNRSPFSLTRRAREKPVC